MRLVTIQTCCQRGDGPCWQLSTQSCCMRCLQCTFSHVRSSTLSCCGVGRGPWRLSFCAGHTVMAAMLCRPVSFEGQTFSAVRFTGSHKLRLLWAEQHLLLEQADVFSSG